MNDPSFPFFSQQFMGCKCQIRFTLLCFAGHSLFVSGHCFSAKCFSVPSQNISQTFCPIFKMSGGTVIQMAFGIVPTFICVSLSKMRLYCLVDYLHQMTDHRFLSFCRFIILAPPLLLVHPFFNCPQNHFHSVPGNSRTNKRPSLGNGRAHSAAEAL